MFGRIRPEFQCFEGQAQNSHVRKNRSRILIFGRIRPEFECVKG